MNPPSTDIRFDNDDTDLCEDARSDDARSDDAQSFATIRSASNVNDSSDDYSLIDAESSRSHSAVEVVDDEMDLPPSHTVEASNNDQLNHDQLPELSHEAPDGCALCEGDLDGCSCDLLPPLRAEMEPVTPPSFEPLAPIEFTPGLGLEGAGSVHSSKAASDWESDSVVSSRSLSVIDRCGLASPRLFDIDDVELKNDMLLTLRYLDSADQ